MTGLSRRRFLSIAACAAAVGAVPLAGAQARVTWRGVALGADVSITLDGPEPVTRPALARARLEIEAFESRFSLYRDESDLSRLNRQGSLPDLDPEWRDILSLCDRLYRVTGGLFDPTIQPLWQAHASGADIAAARALVGWDRVRLPDGSRRGVTLGTGQALSFNGIAQGAATDAVRRVLHDAGLSQVLVDIGETAALGGPFAIGAADPVHGVFARLDLTDTALAVSSPSALRLSDAAQHILDPSGRRHAGWSSVAVLAETAALADGLSTAACLMSEDELRSAAADLGSVRKLVLVDHSGSVRNLFV